MYDRRRRARLHRRRSLCEVESFDTIERHGRARADPLRRGRVAVRGAVAVAESPGRGVHPGRRARPRRVLAADLRTRPDGPARRRPRRTRGRRVERRVPAGRPARRRLAWNTDGCGRGPRPTRRDRRRPSPRRRRRRRRRPLGGRPPRPVGRRAESPAGGCPRQQSGCDAACCHRPRSGRRPGGC